MGVTNRSLGVVKAATWYSGTADSDSAIKQQVTNPFNGDFYFCTESCNIWKYTKERKAWQLTTNIKGANGANGSDGAPGETGPAGAVFTPSVSVSGDLSWTNNGGLQNPTTVNIRGQQGPQGAPGTAATVSVGTVTTGAAGSQASVTNVGNANAAVLNFSIPKGDKGDTGPQGPAATTDHILGLVYPVGSIYMSVNNVSPQTFIGGTWTQIQNTFLLAAGSSYAAGSTGGEATHKLTTAEMPSHTHTQNAHTHTTPPHTHSFWTNDSWSSNCVGGIGRTAARGLGFVEQSGGSYQYRWQNGDGERIATEITMDTYSTTATNQRSGGGGAHNNMPPYLAVYMWKRTA